MVEVLVVVVVVVVLVLVLVVVVVVVVDVVDVVVDVVVGVLVGGAALEGQSFQPSSVTDESEYHVMTSLGVTPSGPSVPEYTTPSTVSLSYPLSVLNFSTTIGTAIDSVTVMVHRSFLPYPDGKLGLCMHPSASLTQEPSVTFHICSEGGAGDVEVLVEGSGSVKPPVYNNRLGEPGMASLTMDAVATCSKRSATWLGVRFGSCWSNSAAAPATCGQAIDVPLMVALPVSDDTAADVIDEPGAKMSRQDPWLLYQARLSSLRVAPTVIAELTCAGEKPHASMLSLPAATTTTTPAAVARSIAASTNPMFP